MSDNNTAIPKEISDKINAYKFEFYDESFERNAIDFGYQLRQQENIELQSQLKAANETIEELRKKLGQSNSWRKIFQTELKESQSALIHEKETRSKEADNYNKRIQEL